MYRDRGGGGGGGGGSSKSEIVGEPLDRKRINDALDKQLQKSSPSASRGLNSSNKDKDRVSLPSTSTAAGSAVAVAGKLQLLDGRDTRPSSTPSAKNKCSDGNKATLVGANNFTQKRSDSPNKDFRNDFMEHITEAYGAELFDSLRVLNFGNKSNESSIDLMGYRAGSKAIFDELTHSGTNNLPIEESETDTEESDVSGSDGDDTSWISWFCNLRGNEFFCEVDDEYIQDDFNLCGLSSQVPYYDYALDLILDVESSHGDSFTEEQNELVESAAEMLYGLIHVRYILSTKGMAAMSLLTQRRVMFQEYLASRSTTHDSRRLEFPAVQDLNFVTTGCSHFVSLNVPGVLTKEERAGERCARYELRSFVRLEN
ncbi:unnamed protein product [Camellia sinensis]